LNKVIISSLDYDIVEDGRKIREILTLTFAEIQYEFFKPAKKQGVTENYSLRYDVAQKILI
jgi:type VI protein secretion system component Hcp